MIVCRMHGEFEQWPRIHLRGSGCPKCGVENHLKADLSPFSKRQRKLPLSTPTDVKSLDYRSIWLPAINDNIHFVRHWIESTPPEATRLIMCKL